MNNINYIIITLISNLIKFNNLISLKSRRDFPHGFFLLHLCRDKYNLFQINVIETH
jgi:hypothetical protein